MKKIIGILLTMVMCFTMSINVFAQSVTYESMDVPTYINSSFKTWMDYRACAWGSAQRNFSEKWGWVDSEGFVRCDGERDLGIEQDYYMIALGSYYGRTIGTKYKFTTHTGRVFYGVLAEFKADCDTNYTHQYSPDNMDIVEFLIKDDVLNYNVKQMGSANVYMPLNGSIAKIEKMTFNWE